MIILFRRARCVMVLLDRDWCDVSEGCASDGNVLRWSLVHISSLPTRLELLRASNSEGRRLRGSHAPVGSWRGVIFFQEGNSPRCFVAQTSIKSLLIELANLKASTECGRNGDNDPLDGRCPDEGSSRSSISSIIVLECVFVFLSSSSDLLSRLIRLSWFCCPLELQSLPS